MDGNDTQRGVAFKRRGSINFLKTLIFNFTNLRKEWAKLENFVEINYTKGACPHSEYPQWAWQYRFL